MSDFIEIGQTVAEIWQFNGFQNGAVRHHGFVKFKFLTVEKVKSPFFINAPNFVKKNRSTRCGDNAIFVIFKDGGRQHFEFLKS